MPNHGILSPFQDPVLQRRLGINTRYFPAMRPLKQWHTAWCLLIWRLPVFGRGRYFQASEVGGGRTD